MTKIITATKMDFFDKLPDFIKFKIIFFYFENVYFEDYCSLPNRGEFISYLKLGRKLEEGIFYYTSSGCFIKALKKSQLCFKKDVFKFIKPYANRYVVFNKNIMKTLFF